MSAENVANLISGAMNHAYAQASDEEAYWTAVRAVQEADVELVWKAMVKLAQHVEPAYRALVPDVLRYLGGQPRPKRAETLALFAEMLRTEREPLVLAAIGTAFVDIDDPAAVDLMAPFATHDDESVRDAVVHALLGHREPHAVDTLIVLSSDPVVHVRDWATFGLGSLLGEPSEETYFDSEPLRAALVARLQDEDAETRHDAMEGLALRKDARALEPIERALAVDDVSPIAIDAAFALASPELVPALERLAARGVVDGSHHSVEEAIAACRGIIRVQG